MCVGGRCLRPFVWRQGDDDMVYSAKASAAELAALTPARMKELRALVTQWRAENDA